MDPALLIRTAGDANSQEQTFSLGKTGPSAINAALDALRRTMPVSRLRSPPMFHVLTTGVSEPPAAVPGSRGASDPHVVTAVGDANDDEVAVEGQDGLNFGTETSYGKGKDLAFGDDHGKMLDVYADDGVDWDMGGSTPNGAADDWDMGGSTPNGAADDWGVGGSTPEVGLAWGDSTPDGESHKRNREGSTESPWERRNVRARKQYTTSVPSRTAAEHSARQALLPPVPQHPPPGRMAVKPRITRPKHQTR